MRQSPLQCARHSHIRDRTIIAFYNVNMNKLVISRFLVTVNGIKRLSLTQLAPA